MLDLIKLKLYESAEAVINECLFEWCGDMRNSLDQINYIQGVDEMLRRAINILDQIDIMEMNHNG